MVLSRLVLLFWDRQQGSGWCGREEANRKGTNTTAAGSADGDTASDSDDDDGCCFIVLVSDAHNAGVNDETGPLCIDAAKVLSSADGVSNEGADTARGDGSGGDSGGDGMELTGKTNATLEIVKFPSGQWEIGTVQEVRRVV